MSVSKGATATVPKVKTPAAGVTGDADSDSSASLVASPPTAASSSTAPLCPICTKPQMAITRHFRNSHNKTEIIQAIMRLMRLARLPCGRIVTSVTCDQQLVDQMSPVVRKERSKDLALGPTKIFYYESPTASQQMQPHRSPPSRTIATMTPPPLPKNNNNDSVRNRNYQTPLAEQNLCSNSKNNSSSAVMLKTVGDVRNNYFVPETRRMTTRKRARRMLDVDNDCSDTENTSKRSAFTSPVAKLDIKEGVTEISTTPPIATSKSDSEIVALVDTETPPCSDNAPDSNKITEKIDEVHTVTKEVAGVVDNCSVHDTSETDSCSPDKNSVPDIPYYFCVKREAQNLEDVSHTVKLYVCYLCNTEFDRKDTLQAHIDEHLRDDVTTQILDMENDYLRMKDFSRDSGNSSLFYSFYIAGYNFGQTRGFDCSESDIQIQYFENLLKTAAEL